MALVFPAPAQIKNLLDPTAPTDAATKEYVDNAFTNGTDIVVGNVTSTGNISSGTGLSTGGNISSTGNISSSGNIIATGNITSTNANLGNVVTANYFVGNGYYLSDIQAGNITGTVSYANYASYAGNITIASQGNITSVGTLASLTVGGTTNLGAIGNITITGGTSGQFISTDGSGVLSFQSQSRLTSTVDSFTGDGTTTSFTLSVIPTNVNYTIVSVQGISQPRSSYSLSGGVLTFSSAPYDTAIIEITTLGGSVSTSGVTIVSVPAHNNSPGTVGQIAYDSSYLYVCVNTNMWIRSAVMSSW